jgi:hypothetical protein
MDIQITTVLATISPAASDADSYIEFSFPAATFSPGQSVAFSWELTSPDPVTESYNQSTDYSYNASDVSLTAWTHVVLFGSGNILWGVVP